jgi:two-component system, OmpR family, sensor histidine kinase CiaH
MKHKSRALFILILLFTYVVLQFLWWEFLLVKQTGQIIDEKQKVIALSVSNSQQLESEIAQLQKKRNSKTLMIVGEGTVFLLLLLYGLYRIKLAQDKENELMRQQNNFFLSITHELKTPIAATKLQLQTLQKQKLDEALKQELIKSALEETERLNNLIDNVLLASRMEASGFKVQMQRTELTELIQQVIRRYFAQELESGVLTFHPSQPMHANLDAMAFTSMLTNLIENALKYSDNEKKVELELYSNEGFVILNVKDCGNGIPPGDREKIFQKFYRAGNEETRKTKGTGLGLYIVKKLALAQNASVKVKANGSKGSIFQIQLHAVA